jgi:glutathione synthase/RimK-type ligase-like ATP-grasp enzyme
MLATAHPVDLHLFGRLLTTPFYRRRLGHFIRIPSWAGTLLFYPAVLLLILTWPWSSLIAHWRALDLQTLRSILRHPLSVAGIKLYAVLPSDTAVLENKSKLKGHALFDAFGVSKPTLHAIIENGVVLWRSPNAGSVIVKPEFGSQGRGIRLVDTDTPGWEEGLSSRQRWVVEEYVIPADIGRARHYRIVTFLRGSDAEVLDVLRYTQPDPTILASNLSRGARRERLTHSTEELCSEPLARAVREARRMHAEGLPNAFVVAWDVILGLRGPCFLELNFAPDCRGDEMALRNVEALVSELKKRLHDAGLLDYGRP